MQIYNKYQLKDYNTFGLQSVADKFVAFEKSNEIIKYLKNNETSKYFVLGGGSNVLLPEKYEGTIFYSKIKGTEIIEQNNNRVIIKAGSGEIWDDFVKFCVDNNFYGAENLSLIPGKVGASAVQNIGAYGVEAKDIIDKVEYIDLKSAEKKIINAKDCNFDYRYSIFKNELKNRVFITAVYYKLSTKENYKLDYGNLKNEIKQYDNVSLQAVRDSVIKTRQAKLPDTNKYGNAGSFFKNPVITKQDFIKLQNLYPEIPYYELDNNNIKIPAGWLIDKAGWKNKSTDKVGVFEKQALVIINKKNAKLHDIINFYSAIQQDILEKYNIKLEQEVITNIK